MAYKVLDIANKILAKGSSDENGELISNMKLQKMLYYMQGFHLAYFETPLFDEEIEAWMYGPVVPSVYYRFQDHCNNGIVYDGEVVSLDPKEENLFNEVFRVYGAFSAIGLMQMTHGETPWKSTETGKGQIIAKEKMQIFFKNRME